jgi:recombinational DNA repair protein RecT
MKPTDLESIIGAWTYLYWSDGTRTAHEMTRAQIEAAWKKGYGTGSTHLAFSEKMAIKTTITSALTMWGNTNPSINIENAHEADVEDVEYQEMPQAAPQALPEAPKVEPLKFTTEASKVEVRQTDAQAMAQGAINFEEPNF